MSNININKNKSREDKSEGDKRKKDKSKDDSKDKINDPTKTLTYSQEILGASTSDGNYSKVIKDFFVKHLSELKKKKVNKCSFRNFLKNCKNALHVKKPPKRKGYAKLVTDEEKRYKI